MKKDSTISPFTKKVLTIISSIPVGKVTTYGIIALHAGSSRGARQVARILHSSSRKYDLPWHRVINKDGMISLRRGAGYEVQKQLLVEDGIIFDDHDQIDFETFLWWPKMKFNITNE